MEKLNWFEKGSIYILTLVTLAINGLYFAGPWYITSQFGLDRPTYALFQSEWVVHVLGFLYLVCAAVIVFGLRPGARSFKPLLIGLGAGFLFRVYNLSGIFLTAPLWPPSYTSQFAATALLGFCWIRVRYVSRP